MMIGFLTSLSFSVTPPIIMIGFLTSLFFGLPGKNDDRIPDLTFFLGYPPRMMIGFHTSLSFSVTPPILEVAPQE